MRLARRMQHGVLSPSVALASRVRRLRASGADIIDFGTRPDVPTHVKEAATAFLDSGASSAYTDARGLPELRHAIAAKLARENTLEVDADAEVVVTAGGKQAVYAAVMALADRGDEVLVEDPGWVSFAPIVHLAGATPVPVPLREENRFVLDPGDLRERITPATRVLLLCNPHNPTGAVHDERSLGAIAEAARAHDLVVVVDESYERLVYDGRRHVSMASLRAALGDRCPRPRDSAMRTGTRRPRPRRRPAASCACGRGPSPLVESIRSTRGCRDAGDFASPRACFRTRPPAPHT